MTDCLTSKFAKPPPISVTPDLIWGPASSSVAQKAAESRLGGRGDDNGMDTVLQQPIRATIVA